MAFYNVCEKCGAHLDPGEPCDCESEQEKRSEFFAQRMRADCSTGQYSLVLDGRESQYDAKITSQL